MPTRFVEVTTPLHFAEAARNSDAFFLFPRIDLSAIPSFANITAGWTAPYERTGLDLSVDMHIPQNPSRSLFIIACFLCVIRAVMLRSATRRALSHYGTARAA
jgi:hypothetical protein